jgi:hypothetical protein
MPAKPAYLQGQIRKQHDQHFAEVMRRVVKTSTYSKSMRDDSLKILKYAEEIADALGVPKDESRPGLEATLQRLAQAIAKASSDDLTAAQIRRHHSNLNRMIPVFKQSTQRATALSRDLMEIHRRLQAIAKLYK